MTQVPASSHGWNGGTVTNPIVINAVAGSGGLPPLDIRGPVTATSEDLLVITDGDTVAAFEVFQTAGHAGGAQIVSTVNGNPVLFLDHEGSAPTANILSIAPGGSVRSRFNKDGYFMTRKVAAPADADLGASEVALWLDDTNGAGKLMVKAKTANGTVVTGSLALA